MAKKVDGYEDDTGRIFATEKEAVTSDIFNEMRILLLTAMNIDQSAIGKPTSFEGEICTKSIAICHLLALRNPAAARRVIAALQPDLKAAVPEPPPPLPPRLPRERLDGKVS